MPLTERQKRAQKKYYEKIKLDPEYRRQKREYAAKYRKENPEKVSRALHKWYLKNKEHHKSSGKEWNANNRERVRVNRRKWVSKNRDKVSATDRKCRKKRINTLSNSYIKDLLTRRGSPLKNKDIPQSLINVKRLELQMKRFIKEQKNG